MLLSIMLLILPSHVHPQQMVVMAAVVVMTVVMGVMQSEAAFSLSEAGVRLHKLKVRCSLRQDQEYLILVLRDATRRLRQTITKRLDFCILYFSPP